MARQVRPSPSVGVDSEGHFLWHNERWSGRHWVGGIMGVRGLSPLRVQIDGRFRVMPASIDIKGTVTFTEDLHPDLKMPWPIGRHAEGPRWLWIRDTSRNTRSLSVIARIPESVLHGLAGYRLGDVVSLEGKLADTPMADARIRFARQVNDVAVFDLEPEGFL